MRMNLPAIHNSYFSLPDPVRWLDRCLNDFKQLRSIRLNQRDLLVKWTRRADEALQCLQRPLIVEMQLYYSCVVKKRVLFHDQVNFETTSVNDKIEIAFRPVAAAACTPEVFARDYPEGRSLSDGPASRLVPKQLQIDYRKGRWEGQYSFCSDQAND